MKKSEVRYLNFPIELLLLIHTDRYNTLDRIIVFGICNYAERHYLNLAYHEEITRQLLYDLYHKKLSDRLLRYIKDLADRDDFSTECQYQGFIGGEWDPDEEAVSSIISALDTDERFYECAYHHYRLHCIKEAAKWQGSTMPDPEASYAHYTKIKKTLSLKPVYGSISVSMAFDFRNNRKTEFELMLLCTFIAIKSIIGKNRIFYKTNNKHIIARALGYNSFKTMPETLPPIIADLFMKYTHDYHFRKLMKRLESWHVLTYAKQMRGRMIGVWDDDHPEQSVMKAMITTAQKSKKTTPP